MYILLLNSLFYDARDKHDTYFVTKLIHNEHSSIKNYHIGVLHSLSQNVLEKLPVTEPVGLTAGAALCFSLFLPPSMVIVVITCMKSLVHITMNKDSVTGNTD